MKSPERTDKRRQDDLPERPNDFGCPGCQRAKNDPDEDCTETAWHGEFSLKPQVSDFAPKAGTVGASAIITGRSFTSRTQVFFDDVEAASVKPLASGKQVTATVPADAKTGHITVSTPRGDDKSIGIFTVMDDAQEKRACEMVHQLKHAATNCGLMAVQEKVVMRCPGSPYTDAPMLFDETDLKNAIALGLLKKQEVSGSFNWEYYVATE